MKVIQVQITVADMGGHWIAYCGFDCATGKDRLSAVRALLRQADLELIGEFENNDRQLELFDPRLYDLRAERVSGRGGARDRGSDADHAD